MSLDQKSGRSTGIVLVVRGRHIMDGSEETSWMGRCQANFSVGKKLGNFHTSDSEPSTESVVDELGGLVPNANHSVSRETMNSRRKRQRPSINKSLFCAQNCGVALLGIGKVNGSSCFERHARWISVTVVIREPSKQSKMQEKTISRKLVAIMQANTKADASEWLWAISNIQEGNGDQYQTWNHWRQRNWYLVNAIIVCNT